MRKEAKPYVTAKPGVKGRRHRDPRVKARGVQGIVGRPSCSPGSARRQSPSEKTGVSRRPMAARDDGAAFVL
jgi:hypothetical protein